MHFKLSSLDCFLFCTFETYVILTNVNFFSRIIKTISEFCLWVCDLTTMYCITARKFSGMYNHIQGYCATE